MYNILITGVSRTGKSTLAKKMYEALHDSKSNYSLVPFDPFIDSWKDKQIIGDQSFGKWKELEFSDTCREMIAYSIRKLSKKQYENQNFIFESAHASYDPEHFNQLIEKYQLKNLKIIYLMHDTEYTTEKLIQQVRDNDCEADWTFHKDKRELLYKFTCALQANSAALRYFKESNQMYYVTSYNRSHVFDEILKTVKDQI